LLSDILRFIDDIVASDQPMMAKQIKKYLLKLVEPGTRYPLADSYNIIKKTSTGMIPEHETLFLSVCFVNLAINSILNIFGSLNRQLQLIQISNRIL
jgi:hypothetical protein